MLFKNELLQRHQATIPMRSESKLSALAKNEVYNVAFCWAPVAILVFHLI